MTHEEAKLRAWFNCNSCNTEWVLTIEDNKRSGTKECVGDYECLYCHEKQTYFIGWDDNDE